MKKIMIILVLMISFFPFIDNVKAEETGYIGSCDCCTLTGTKEVETYSCSVMYDKYYDYSKGYSCSQVCSFGGILNGYSDRNSLRACPSNSNKQCEKKENLENISKENECKESGGTWEEGVCKKYYCYSCAENVRGQYTYGVKIWASSNEELKNKLIEYNNSKQNKIPITVEDCSVMENTPESQCYGDTTDENSDIIENENEYWNNVSSMYKEFSMHFPSMGFGEETNSCSEVLGESLSGFLKVLVRTLQGVGTVVTLMMGMITFAGAVAQKDADALNKAFSKCAKLLIVLALILLIPTLVRFIGNLAGFNIDCI